MALNPLPVAVTCVPTLPDVGLSARARPTVKEPLALLLLPSVPTIVCAPAVDSGAAKLVVKPPEALDVAVPTCASSYVTVIGELAAKPVPVTVTWVPGVPEDGFSVREGATVNALCALPAPSSLAATVCNPAVDGGALNVAVKSPDESEVTVDGVVVTCAPPYVIVIAEEGAKFVPETVTCMPTGPDAGDRVMEGGDWAITVNDAEDEVLPATALTVPTPATAEDGTANVALNAPEELAVTVAGLVLMDVPLKVTATVAPAG